MKAGRLPAWVWVLGAWGLLVAVGALLEMRWGVSLETCLFLRTTGYPCPTCGSTRSVLALLRGDWIASLRASPLLWVVAALMLYLGLMRLHSRTPIDNQRIRPWHVALGLLLLLANWVWILANR